MTLLDQCQSVSEGLSRAHLANQTRQQIAAIQQRAQEWSTKKARHGQLRERLTLLVPDPRTLPGLESANSAVVALVREAKSRLNTGDVSTLSQEGLWMRLLATADSANDQTSTAIRQAWKALILEQGDVTSPSNLDARVLKTPANEAAMTEYRRAFTQYEALSRQEMPVDAMSINKLRDAVAATKAAREKMTLSAPREIKAFLDAVDAGGAALRLLTPEVQQWLSSHDDPERFVIKSRSTASWR